MTVELLRQGAITEIVGPLGSGRTSLVLGCLADATRDGGAAALVDGDDAFDPVTAAAAGVDLARTLWVRCGGRRDLALRAVDVLVRCPGFALVVLDVGESPPRLPLAAAFRWRLAARRAGVGLVVVGRRRVLGGGVTLAVSTDRHDVVWAGPAAAPTRLDGTRTRLTVLRDGRPAPSAVERRRAWNA
jgi:hypothetical protein